MRLHAQQKASDAFDRWRGDGFERQDGAGAKECLYDRVREDRTAQARGEVGEGGDGEEFCGNALGKGEQGEAGVADDVGGVFVTVFGEIEDGGGERGDLAIGFSVLVEPTRDRPGVGRKVRVFPNKVRETSAGCPALEFEEGAGDGEAADFVAGAFVAEAPAKSARVVGFPGRIAGGDE